MSAFICKHTITKYTKIRVYLCVTDATVSMTTPKVCNIILYLLIINTGLKIIITSRSYLKYSQYDNLFYLKIKANCFIFLATLPVVLNT